MARDSDTERSDDQADSTTPPARIAVRLEGASLDRNDLESRYRDWLVRIEEMHQNPRALSNPRPAFSPLTRPLHSARVALLTTAGAYVDGDTPFDVADPDGDPSFRVIPSETDVSRLRFAHSHYDTARAEQDPNVVLPIEPLRALVQAGVVGEASPHHIGMMGFNPDPRRLVRDWIPKVVRLLLSDKVDVVVFSPG